MLNRRQLRLRGLGVVLGLLILGGGCLLWVSAPRSEGPFAFVQIGAVLAKPDAFGTDKSVNLPFSSFECSEQPSSHETTCTRELEGKPLTISFTTEGAKPSACQAEYAGTRYPCASGFLFRGSPERTFRIEHDLGFTPDELRAMRLRDPLSHVSEGDWGVPTWIAALLVAGLFARGAQVALRQTRPAVRLPLIGVAALVGLGVGVLLFIAWRLYLGYVD
jgi:hypothetical protein